MFAFHVLGIILADLAMMDKAGVKPLVRNRYREKAGVNRCRRWACRLSHHIRSAVRYSTEGAKPVRNTIHRPGNPKASPLWRGKSQAMKVSPVVNACQSWRRSTAPLY
jgi:hypothetical protein